MLLSWLYAAGRAVLSFDDCAGIAEIVESGKNGVLVSGSPAREERVEALANGLRRMMADPELCDRLGRAGPAGVTRFGLDAVLDRWEEVLLQAAGSTSRSGLGRLI